MKTDLDAFESRLLTELQAHVAERSTADGGADEWPRRSARPRFVLVAAGAAAAVAAVAVVVGLPGKGSSPAYSVGEGNAGQIHVEINRPEDASGLERALEEHGIAADITYLQALQTCALGRYTEVNRKFDGMGVEVGAAHLGAPSVRNRAGWRDVRSDLVGTAYECRGHQGCRAAGLPGCRAVPGPERETALPRASTSTSRPGRWVRASRSRPRHPDRARKAWVDCAGNKSGRGRFWPRETAGPWGIDRGPGRAHALSTDRVISFSM